MKTTLLVMPALVAFGLASTLVSGAERPSGSTVMEYLAQRAVRLGAGLPRIPHDRVAVHRGGCKVACSPQQKKEDGLLSQKTEKKKKARIDSLLVEKGLVATRQKAQALIMAGKVLCGSVVIDKPGKEVLEDSEITVKEPLPFVGRGGVKLSGFLDETGVEVGGLVAMDIGASTGGFTDCLLNRGAKKVYAIDVGKGLIDISLRNDPRVVVMEERNIRYMEPSDIGEAVDLAVIGVSFISLQKDLPKAREFVKAGGLILALVKPQFEVGKGQRL